MAKLITFQSNEVVRRLQRDNLYIKSDRYNEKFYRGLPFHGNPLFALKCDGSRLMCALALLAMPSKPQWAIVYDHPIFKAIDFVKWHTHKTYKSDKIGNYTEYLTPNIRNVITMVQITESEDMESIQDSYLKFLEKGIPVGCNEWAGHRIKPSSKWTDKDRNVFSSYLSSYSHSTKTHSLSMYQVEEIISHVLTEMVVTSDVQQVMYDDK